MPMLNLVSIKCIKRDDDGLQSKDEPYFVVVSDNGDEFIVKPGRGRKHDISKGEKITEFTRDKLRFNTSISVCLKESDHDKIGLHSKDEVIGKFTAKIGQEGDGVIKKTLKKGKDAHYVVQYKVEKSPEEEAEERVDERIGELEDKVDDLMGGLEGSRPRGDGGVGPGNGGERQVVRLNLTRLSREQDTSGHIGGLARIRLKVGGILFVSEAALREGESAIDAPRSRVVTSPLSMQLEERAGVGDWALVASLSEEWDDAPNTRAQARTLTTNDGHVYAMEWQLTVSDLAARTSAKVSSKPGLNASRPVAQAKPGPKPASRKRGGVKKGGVKKAGPKA